MVFIKRNNTFYSIIPAAVRYDLDISSNAKLIYSEISALSNKRGYCFATNRYFAEAFGVSISSVSKWIHQLSEKNFIRIEYNRNGVHIDNRKIYINADYLAPLDFLQINPSTKCEETHLLDEKDNNHAFNTIDFTGIYGELNNVYLRDDEYKKLIRRCGIEETNILINDLSYHIGSTGKKYKSHYYTLLSWYRKKAQNKIKHPSDWYYNADEV